MDESIATLRSRSHWAYLFGFGALSGIATFGYTTAHADGSTDSGMLAVWIAMALVGLALTVRKDLDIPYRRLRIRIALAEGAAIVLALALIAVLPGFIGMLKGLAVLAVFLVYFVWYFATLDKAQYPSEDTEAD